MRFKDLTGQRFGKLVVIRENTELSKEKGSTIWECKCDCGNIANIGRWIGRNSNSCGCMSSRKMAGDRTRTHGMSETPFYQVWRAMKMRCQNPSQKSYKDYGGKGISVCERWNKFESFYEDMWNTFEEGLTIERIDIFKNYSPENCKWIPRCQQNSNKRNSRIYTYNGESLNLVDICRKYNIDRGIVTFRLNKGFTIEDAIETPVRKQKNNAYKIN